MIGTHRCCMLLEDPLIHHRDPISQGHGLNLIVGDIHRGGPKFVMDTSQFNPIWFLSFASRFERGSSMSRTLGRRTRATECHAVADHRRGAVAIDPGRVRARGHQALQQPGLRSPPSANGPDHEPS